MTLSRLVDTTRSSNFIEPFPAQKPCDRYTAPLNNRANLVRSGVSGNGFEFDREPGMNGTEFLWPAVTGVCLSMALIHLGT